MTGSGSDHPLRARAHRGGAPLAAVLGVLLALVAGCGPSTVSLAELAADQEGHHGEEVVVHGVVVEIEEDGPVPHHAVLQDSEDNRVELVPFEEAEPHIGSMVRVTGQFEFDPDRGRRLLVESIEPAGG